MSRATHDYAALRVEYIQSDISIRELCRKHDIKSWSTVNARKKDEDWDKAREEFRARVSEREITALVDTRIRTLGEIHQELLLAIRHAIRRYVADVTRQDNPQAVSARDLMGLIDKFLLLAGTTPHRTESKSVDVHAVGAFGDFADILRGAPDDVLRELAELAGKNGAGAQSVGSGPLVVLEGTRSA